MKVPWATSAAVGKSGCTMLSGLGGAAFTLPQTGFPAPPGVSVAIPPGVELAAAVRGNGWMTLPACGNEGAAVGGTGDGP